MRTWPASVIISISYLTSSKIRHFMKIANLQRSYNYFLRLNLSRMISLWNQRTQNNINFYSRCYLRLVPLCCDRDHVVAKWVVHHWTDHVTLQSVQSAAEEIRRWRRQCKQQLVFLAEPEYYILKLKIHGNRIFPPENVSNTY